MTLIKKKVVISEDDLSIEDVIAIARFNIPIELSQKSIDKIKNTRNTIKKIIKEKKVVYGITTGVGDNSKVKIDTSESKKLQENLIKSHACGVGEPLEKELVKAVMVVMIKNLSLGYSGIRLETLEYLIKIINNNIIPVVPKEGSLGYLIYQAHISLVLLGEGQAFYKGKVISGRKALNEIGLKPLELYEKEGLSLINGTADMTAMGAVAVYDSFNIMKSADIVSTVSFEALKGTYHAFDKRISQVKKHPGQQSTISNLHDLLAGSEISEKFKDYKLQDALSIRAIPQVHGACKDTVNYVKNIVEREMNSATDNPLVFNGESTGINDDVISSANCHGESVAMVLDFLAISISEISSMAERRIFRLTTSQHSGLPAFLAEESGVNSGYMIPQYTAASLVSDNKRLSNPAVVDSITTSAGQEDHVVMGPASALKALKTITNAHRIVGIELMVGCQGLDFLRPLKSGIGVEAIYNYFRKTVPTLKNDRILYNDIKDAELLIKKGEMIEIVENEIGELIV